MFACGLRYFASVETTNIKKMSIHLRPLGHAIAYWLKSGELAKSFWGRGDKKTVHPRAAAGQVAKELVVSDNNKKSHLNLRMAFRRMHDLMFASLIAGGDASMALVVKNIEQLTRKERQTLLKEVGFDLEQLEAVLFYTSRKGSSYYLVAIHSYCVCYEIVTTFLCSSSLAIWSSLNSLGFFSFYCLARVSRVAPAVLQEIGVAAFCGVGHSSGRFARG